MRHNSFLIVCLFLVCMCVNGVVAFAQSKAVLKQEAEAQLSKMTPDEIDRRLKEAGVSREEAIIRARDLNISLEDYLVKTVPSPQKPAGVTTPPSNAVTVPAPSVQAEAPPPASTQSVGGISQRVAYSVAPFGYDLFRYSSSTFEPILNASSPPSYLLGPGDELIVNVWGETKLYYQVPVNREGNVIIPDVGPVSANGTTIAQFRDRLLRRMTTVYSGLASGSRRANTFLDVSLGKLRTLQVFVLGEVLKPGGYSISSFSTAFNALYLSGGPTVNGTLRDVQVLRSGEKLPPVDLYEYLLKGDNSRDVRLQDGDIVFVRPAGKRVALIGDVLRPAIYELKENETLGDLLAMAGGLRFDAYFDRLHVERIVPFDERKKYDKDILDFDLRFNSLNELIKSGYGLEAGDVLSVFSIGTLAQNRVSITGNVQKPGTFEFKPGMRVADLLRSADSLQRNTFAERGTLFRLLQNLRREVIPFNPRLALLGDETNNIPLQNEDSVVLYKESQFFPAHTVFIAGAVRAPGTYPRNENMTVNDLVVMAGGVREDASLTGWQITRIDTSGLGNFSTVAQFSVPTDYWDATTQQKIMVMDFDYVFVPTDPLYNQPKFVQITGHVMSPGLYAIRYEGERLASLIARAGGPKPGAYLEASRLVRKVPPIGGIPMEFQKALRDTSSIDNAVLREGDSIHIATNNQVVLVTGEVFIPSPVLYKKGESLRYYVEQAGGYREEADMGRVIVTLPSGKRMQRGTFFLPDPDLPAGSVVLVPKEVQKDDRTLPIIRDMATILAGFAAITVALVQVTK